MKTMQLKWGKLYRYIRLLFVCLLVSASAFSQTKQIELQAGFLTMQKFYQGFNVSGSYYNQFCNLYQFPVSENEESLRNFPDNHTPDVSPLTIQLLYRHTVAKRWILTTGLSYIQDGYGTKEVLKYTRNDSITSKEICFTDSYKHLNIPFLVSYSFTEKKIRPYIGAGIYIGYLLSAKRSRIVKNSHGPHSEELNEIIEWGNIAMNNSEEKLSSGRIMFGLNAHAGLCFQLNKNIGMTLPEIAIVHDLLRSADLYKEGDVGVPLGKWNKVEPLSRFTVSFGLRYSIN